MKSAASILIGAALSVAACGGSSGASDAGNSNSTFTFLADGIAQDDSSGFNSAASGGIVEASTTAEDGSALNITQIKASNVDTGSFITLSVPVWPLTVGSWSCPSGWEVGIIYGPPGVQAYYAGQNGEINPDSATAPCTIAVTSVSPNVAGTFSGTVGNASGAFTLTSGSFSIPASN